MPFYLATREFFRLARDRLEPGGILALNVASVPGDESLLDGISGTLKHEFDFVAVWPALRFNKILLAFDEKWALRPEIVSRGPAALRPLRELLARRSGRSRRGRSGRGPTTGRPSNGSPTG